MFISQALAQEAGNAAGPGALGAFLPIILIFVVFYFLLIRPQQKKMKQHKEMLAAIRRGDRIVTGGGIVGNVTKVIDDNEVQVEIAEGVRVRVHRGLISTVLAKSQPTGDTKEPKETSKASSKESTRESSKDSKENDAATPRVANNDDGRGSRLRKMLGGKNE
jgi:preprotein translocase subunit YajC